MRALRYVQTLPFAERLRRAQPELASRIYADEVLAYLDHGFVTLEPGLDAALVDRCAHDVDHLFQLARGSATIGNLGVSGPGDLRTAGHLRNLNCEDWQSTPPGLKIYDLEGCLPSVAQLVFSEPIVAFIESILGEPAAFIGSVTFGKGSELPLHRDFPYHYRLGRAGHLMSAWIPLEDVSADSGPLVCYDRSHFPDRHGFFDWGDGRIVAEPASQLAREGDYQRHLERVVTEHSLQPHSCLPKRGEVIFFHGALIHGGEPVRDVTQTRKSIIAIYTSVASHPELQSFRRDRVYDLRHLARSQTAGQPVRWRDRLQRYLLHRLSKPAT